MRPINLIQRCLAVLLAAVLLIGLVPAGAVAASRPTSEPADVWDAISALEEERFSEMPRLMDGDDAPAAEDIALVVDDVAALVTSRSDYVEGSLLRNGDFISWKTADGVINGYSPSLRVEDEVDGVPTLAGDGTTSSSEPWTEASGVQLMDGESLSEVSEAQLMAGDAGERDLVVFSPWSSSPYEDWVDTDFLSLPYHEAEITANYTGGRADWVQGMDVTIDAIARAIESYGMVIIYTHGRTDFDYHKDDQSSHATSSYITIQSSKGLTADDYTYGLSEYKNSVEDQDWSKDKDENGNDLIQDMAYKNAEDAKAEAEKQGVSYYPHCFKFVKIDHPETRYAVDGYVIARHMNRQAPDNMVYFIGCLTMASEGLCAPLREKGVNTVFGYSQSVYFRGAHDFFHYFMEGLRMGQTAAGAFNYMRKQADCNWDPSCTTIWDDTIGQTGWTRLRTKAEAIRDHIAFPYMVSPQDQFYDKENYSTTIEQKPESTWKLPLLSDYDPKTGETTVPVTLDLNESFSLQFYGVNAGLKETGQAVGNSCPDWLQFARVHDEKDYRQDYYCISGKAEKAGYLETTLTLSFQNGTAKKFRFQIQVAGTAETSSQTADLKIGIDQTVPFQLPSLEANAQFLKVEKTYGSYPSGMTLVYDTDTVPQLMGTPTVAKDCSLVFLVRLKSSRVIRHSLSVRIKPTETLKTSQNVTLTGDVLASVPLDTGLEGINVSAIGYSVGSVPGMYVQMSMDEEPHLYGRPSSAGSFTKTVQLCLSDGRVVNHSIHVTVVPRDGPIGNYVVDVSSGQSGIIEWKDFDNHIRPTLQGAAAAGQIGLTEGPQKTTIDVDNDGTWDIEYSKVMNSYRFQLLSTASQSSSYVLKLSDDALAELKGSTKPYAKSIEFIFSEVYGLKVYNKQVTSANRENIFKGEWYGATTNLDGVFSYDGAGTLTIKGSLWNNLIDIPIVESDIPLTINVLEYSHLGCGPSAIVANRDLTITGPGVLEVESNDAPAIEVNNGSTLTIRDMELRVNKYKASFAAGPVGISDDAGLLVIDHAHVKAFGQEAALSYFDSIELKNCQIAAPEKGSIEYGSIVDSSGEPATEVEIIPCEATYDLWIDGVQVTDVNAADILGDGDFSYSDGYKTLTINASGSRLWNHNPDRGFPMIRSGIQGLTIRADNDIILRNNGIGGCLLLEGDTDITGNGRLSFVSMKNAAVIVSGDSTLRIHDMPYFYVYADGGPGLTGSGVAGRGARDRLVLEGVDYVHIIGENAAIVRFGGGACVATGDFGMRIKSPKNARFSDGAVVYESGDPAPNIELESFQEYQLRIDGNLVDDSNRNDILGNGIFSFDGDHTLSVKGDFTTYNLNIIENGIPGLVIRIEMDSSLRVEGMTGNMGVCILALEDTTITGPGKLSLFSVGYEPLGAGYGANITLDDLDLTIDNTQEGHWNGCAIIGSGALRVNHCSVYVEDNNAALCGFGQGITLTDCSLLEPTEGGITQKDGEWCITDGTGEMAKAVRIGAPAAPASISLTPEGDAIQYSIPVNAGGAKGTVIAAWYDENGQMTGTSQAEVTMDGQITGTLPVTKGAVTYKLFVLDADGAPVRQAWSSAE